MEAFEPASAEGLDASRRFVTRALELYRAGLFPMQGVDPDAPEEVRWVQPRRRALIPLDERFRVPRSLKQRIRSGTFTITSDRAFSHVIRACADPSRPGAWIDASIIELFELLHAAGHAHSVEAWVAAEPSAKADAHRTVEQTSGESGGLVLVGGLYGLALGRIFCGESMFSWPHKGGTDASKVCLVKLVEHLRRRGFVVLDAQLSSEHLMQFGLREVGHGAYARLLHEHAGDEHTVAWEPFAG